MMPMQALTRRAAHRLVLTHALALAGGAALARDTAPAVAELDLAGTRLGFATQAQTQALIQKDDAWLQAASPFQRAATMGLAGKGSQQKAPGLARFKSFLASTALDWPADEKTRWQKAAQELAPRLAQLQLAQKPQRIQLALTDGRDAANTPYTRGDTIYLPRNYAGKSSSDLELLAHEYFHILTRENPELAQSIYQLLGFSTAGELEWPAEWLPARIANPDAPHSRNVMALQREGKTMHVMPLLVAHRTELQPGETFFHVLDVRLLSVTPGAGQQPSRALRGPNGQLQWTEVSETRDYLQRLGGNTNYVFHPEETAADNFAYLVSGRKVRNPELLTQLAQRLRAGR